MNRTQKQVIKLDNAAHLPNQEKAIGSAGRLGLPIFSASFRRSLCAFKAPSSPAIPSKVRGCAGSIHTNAVLRISFLKWRAGGSEPRTHMTARSLVGCAPSEGRETDKTLCPTPWDVWHSDRAKTN